MSPSDSEVDPLVVLVYADWLQENGHTVYERWIRTWVHQSTLVTSSDSGRPQPRAGNLPRRLGG